MNYFYSGIWIKFIISLILIQLSCVSVYFDNPKQESLTEIPNQKIGKKLNYYIANDTQFKGKEVLESKLKECKYFDSIENNAYAESEEYFLRININHKLPTFSTATFFYLSYLTYTIVPAWSNQYGYNVFIEFYSHGNKNFETYYLIRKEIAIWIGLIPFIWVNFLTGFETEAFSQLYDQFIIDMMKEKRQTD
ncbi:MAG: hypothetical protein JJT78_13635 [Leptospira sp.]|nr:hypothetical protein [Leptospira sp.]